MSNKILYSPKEGTSGFFKIEVPIRDNQQTKTMIPKHLRIAPPDPEFTRQPNRFLSWLSVIGIKTLFFVVGIGERLKIF